MDFEKMKREDFLDSIYGINEVNTETIPVEQKKFLSGGFYFLQEFFKKQLELSESFQKLLHFEANRNDIDFHKYYCIEIELYNSFFEKFPSAKEETEYKRFISKKIKERLWSYGNQLNGMKILIWYLTKEEFIH